jgi:hypothetical protein
MLEDVGRFGANQRHMIANQKTSMTGQIDMFTEITMSPNEKRNVVNPECSVGLIAFPG